jgi:hypothetical protein
MTLRSCHKYLAGTHGEFDENQYDEESVSTTSSGEKVQGDGEVLRTTARSAHSRRVGWFQWEKDLEPHSLGQA